MKKFEIPVLLIAWRRPNHLKQVIDAIRIVEPKELFVAVDGPRMAYEYAEERKLIEETKRIIETQIDWDCKINTLYQNENLGCAKGVSSAISWFFDHVEEGIILEDDCVPSTTFFQFCQIMLKRYKSNNEIMHIGGTNYHFGERFGLGGYYYSKYCHIWGWATWRRAWLNFKLNIVNDLSLIDTIVKNHCEYPNEIRFWNLRFKEQINLEGDTWDFQWLFCVWRKNGMAIYPNYNLVTNIGLGENLGGTHITKTSDKLVYDNNVSIHKLTKKPFFKKRFIWADNQNYHRAFGVSKDISIRKKINIIYHLIKKLIIKN